MMPPLLFGAPAYVMAQVVDLRGDTVELDRGSEWGLSPGQRGGLFRVPREGQGGIYGILALDSVWEGGARGTVQGDKRAAMGDLAQFKVELDGEEWNLDPYLGCLRLHIFFTDTGGRLIFWGDPEDHTPRDSALGVMVSLARWISGGLEGLTDTMGRPLDSLLAQADTSLVLEFLYFVVDFPVAYMGRELSFAKAIATWAKWGAPPSGHKVALRVLAGESPELVARNYPRGTLMVALDWLVRFGRRDLARRLARASGDPELVKLVEEAP